MFNPAFTAGRGAGAVILSTAGVDNTLDNQILSVHYHDYCQHDINILHLFQVRDVFLSLWFLMSKYDTRNLKKFRPLG